MRYYKTYKYIMMNAIEKQKRTKKDRKCLDKKLTISISLLHMTSDNENIVFNL